MKAVTILFYKPYGVVSQFTPLADHTTLKDFNLPSDVYPCGRLDHDSEGLLLLTSDGALQHRISDPKFAHPRTYLAQVERVPTPEVLSRLCAGVKLKDGMTRPCKARRMDPEPVFPPRTPPIRFRKNVLTAWLEITLNEGRNRQVRRMTAVVGHPTLRLVRVSLGEYTLENLLPGQWRQV